MKITLTLGQDADLELVKDESGAAVAIVFTPNFTKKTGQATLAYGEVRNANGVLLDKFSLTVSGATGKLAKAGRVEAVTAAADDLKE